MIAPSEQVAAVPPVLVSAPRQRSDSECREIPYDSAAGPRLFDVVEVEEGSVTFVSDLPYAAGDRFVTVRDEDYDAPPSELPVEVVVADVVKDEGLYRVTARFPPRSFAPSRLVGPLPAADHQLVGRAGDGDIRSVFDIGRPQLLYQVWLQQGVLENVVVRCSRTVYVDQLWMVTDRRRCIRSSFERIEGRLL